MIIKIENVFKDYLKYFVDMNYRRKASNFIISEIDNKVYMSEGHILCVLDKEFYKIPFITQSAPDMSRIIDKNADKIVYVSEYTINITGIECFVILDDEGREITYLNRKMLEKWFNIKDCELVMTNLDNKSPVYIKYLDQIQGLILPIRKV